jgi:aarF domain-containing kinase
MLYTARVPFSSALVLSGAAAVFAKILTNEPFRRAIYFWRKAGPMVAHYRFTRWWLDCRYAGPKHRKHRDMVYDSLHQRYCDPALRIMLHLKGLYVKIGQVMSARPDFVPACYVQLFSTLQDSVPQLPIEQIRRIIAESLSRERQLDFNDVFETMDAQALGSASIGQVHRAVLTESWSLSEGYTGGREVAVKVMHPGSQLRFKHDFSVFRWLCRVALPGWLGLLEELEKQMMTEFDYNNEALSLQQVRMNMWQSPFKQRVVVPQPHLDLTTKHVLVMEMLHGRKLVDHVQSELSTAFGSKEQAASFINDRQRDALSGIELHSNFDIGSLSTWTKLKLLRSRRSIAEYLDLLIDLHGYQIFIDGCWNGDPHPGNCLVLSCGRLGLIDYGQTKRLTNDERLAFAQVTNAIGNGVDDAIVGESMRQAGFTLRDNNDDAALTKYAKIFFDSDHEGRRLGFPTPQQYFASLMLTNPLVTIPDPAGKRTDPATHVVLAKCTNVSSS